MKIGNLLIAAAAAAAMSLAAVSANADTSSKFIGTWSLDLSNAPPPAEGAPPLPKSITLVTTDAGGGKWKSAVDIVAADGTTTHEETTYGLDGTPAAITNDPNVDMIAVTSPDPNTLVIKETKDGKPVDTTTVKLSDDGNTQMATIVSTGPDGKPVTRTESWKRTE